MPDIELNYYKIVTELNNIKQKIEVLCNYCNINNKSAMPLYNIIQEFKNDCNNLVIDYNVKYNNCLIILNKIVCKLDYTRLIYNDLFITNVVNNIINKVNIAYNLNYKLLQLDNNVNINYNNYNNVIVNNNNYNNGTITEVTDNTDTKKQEKNEIVIKGIIDNNNNNNNKSVITNNYNGIYFFKSAKNLKSLYYTEKSNKLLITFKKSNKTYLYNNITMDIIANLINKDKNNEHATSYFNAIVVTNKEKYPYKCIV